MDSKIFKNCWPSVVSSFLFVGILLKLFASILLRGSTRLFFSVRFSALLLFGCDVEYLNGKAEFLSHGDGRVTFDEDGSLHWQYRIADHLGNTVVLFEDKDGDGSILDESGTDDPELLEVLQRNVYYPFGMGMEGSWQSVQSNPDNKYLYNGKEMQDDLGLDWLDYGARLYDPAIGRWNEVDPLAAEMPEWSPYNYTFGNPIGYIDPDGRAPEAITPETAWDIINVVMGAASFGGNVAVGNVGGAVVDGIGLIYDGFATAVPVLPGGAGSLIGAYRFVRVSDNLVGSINKVSKLEVIKSSERLTSLASKAQNSIKNHLKLDDVAGAVQDILGIPVEVNGRVYDHLKEVNEGLGSLQNFKAGLQHTLKNSRDLSDDSIKALNSSIKETEAHMNRINKILDKTREVQKTLE